MILHCTLVGGPESRLPRALELTITAPDGAAGADIAAQLAENFGTGTVTVDGVELGRLHMGSPPLVTGAVMVDGGDPPQCRAQARPPGSSPAARLALAVHSGAGAGTVVPLRRGVYTLGRSDARIVIADPELSRRHARVVVTDTDISIEDLGSANGTYVDGRKIRDAPVTTGSTIRCGNSTMSVVFTDMVEWDLSAAGSPVLEPINVPRSADPGSRGPLLLAAVLPLAVGVGLAVLTGMWMFLAFAATSALALLIPVITGRRQRRDLAAAVGSATRQDRQRRLAAGPSLAVLVLAAAADRLSTAETAEPGEAWLRLGQAEQPANVLVERGTTSVGIPSAGTVPVFLGLSGPRTVVQGMQPLVDGMVRSILMQLSGYPRCRNLSVIVHGQPALIPLAARYLPGVTLTASPADCRRALTQGPKNGHGQGLLLLPQAAADTAGAALALDAVREGWHVVEFHSAGPPADRADVLLSESGSTLCRPEGDLAFIPDLAPAGVFAAYARQQAALPRQHGTLGSAVPATCILQQLLPPTAAATAGRWDAAARSNSLAVPLGYAAGGARILDLHSDGPHLLVAGTTGSGKSELLRSLALGLALCHAPDKVNLLFIDFKGGSGLGPLTGLVHCVGMVTDLAPGELDRTLASLRAETRLREEVLAAARAQDLTAYRAARTPTDPALPHLVVIIDEFRMLVDEAPEALRELMRIASIGRALGIHLVMATQRPQGALSADIRANVTSSIALRVQSGMESVDIIGSTAAAAISRGSPGRAFLVRGTEPPEEFQAATIHGVHATGPQDGISVLPTTAYLASSPTDEERQGPETPDEAGAPLAAVIREVWDTRQGHRPRRPVAAPLPEDLGEPPWASGTPDDAALELEWPVQLGLMDVPDEQRVQPLTWGPARDGHLALIGAPGSGAAEALELAVRRVLLGPGPFHCYFLDGNGAFHAAARHPRVGAHAGLHELRHAVRILERLAHELSRRLSRPGGPGAPLILVVSGWGAWMSGFRAGPFGRAEDLVHDLIRDGAGAGITVLISGDRELVHARFSAALPNRLYFPALSNDDSRLGWPRMPSAAAVKSRAVAFGPVSANSGGTVCQLYRPAGDPNPYDHPAGSARGSTDDRPFRVEPLPARITTTEVRVLAAGTAPSAAAGTARSPAAGTAQPGLLPADLLIGVCGDELAPVSIRLQPGSVLAVLGGPGSGKTNVLAALRELNPVQVWLSARPQNVASGAWAAEELLKARTGQLPKETVLVADDADLMPPAALRDLAELHALGWTVVMTANYSPLLLQRVPLAMGARAAGTGLLLGPRSMADGDVFGVRFEVEPGPPPGRAVVISGGCATPVQTAWSESHNSSGTGT